MKEVRQAIVLVDNYRRPSRQRNTVGRYVVSAKTEKEAINLVQKTIGFGSVQFYYWVNDNSFAKINYREVRKLHLSSQGKWELQIPHHACECQNIEAK